MAKFKQGLFTPTNPDRYVGDLEKIIFRSSWELYAFEFLDTNTTVLEWGSEIVAIPYIKPTDNKPHKYYPDLYVKFQDKHGNVRSELIEIKPANQCKQPTTKGRKSAKTKAYEAEAWQVNVAKWKFAKEYCEKRDIKFKILTEHSLFR